MCQFVRQWNQLHIDIVKSLDEWNRFQKLRNNEIIVNIHSLNFRFLRPKNDNLCGRRENIEKTAILMGNYFLLKIDLTLLFSCRNK